MRSDQVTPDPPVAAGLRRTLAGVIAVLLVVGLVAAGFLFGSSPGPLDGANDGGGGDGVTAPSGRGGVPFEPGTPPAPTVEAAARSIAFEGGIDGLAGVSLTGASSFTASASEVVDGSGAKKGAGTVSTVGPAFSFTGSSMRLSMVGELRMTATSASFLNPSPSSEVLQIAGGTPITINLPTVSFTPTESSPATEIPGPVRIVVRRDGSISVRSEGDVGWQDPPPAMRLKNGNRSRATLSWAGDGVVRTSAGEARAGHLGIKSDDLDIALERRPEGMTLLGRASLLQAYADGLPTMTARGRVRVKSQPGQVPRGGRGSFTWAPENDGDTDMVMTRIRPDSPSASWVSLGLARLPAMCGGEPCPRRGGDTTGLGRGKPINAVIIPGTGDERDISFGVRADAPLGRHEIVLVVEGNFEPIRVAIQVEVVEAPPPSTRPTG